VFDEIREGTATKRAQYFEDFTIPFYGYNRPAAKKSQGYQGQLVAPGDDGRSQCALFRNKGLFRNRFHRRSQKCRSSPSWCSMAKMIRLSPFPISGAKTIKLLKNGKLISYPGFPHGMPATEAATINKDLLAFIKS
jgi:non-heme chloroperoxidase